MPSRTEISRSLAEDDYPGLGRYVWRPADGGLEWSRGLVEIYGRQAPPASEAEFMACLHPDDRIRVEGETEAFLTGDADSYSHSFRIIRPDGDIRYLIDRARIDRDAQGRVTEIHGLNMDVTDFPHLARVSMDQQSSAAAHAVGRSGGASGHTRESEARLALAQEVAGIGVWDANLKEGCSLWTAGLYDLLRINRETPASPALFMDMVHPDDVADVRHAFEKAISERTLFESEFRIVRRDGVVRHVLGKGRVIEEEDGRATRMVGVNYDITERKHAEDQLRESRAQLKTILDQTVAMVGILDPDGTLREVNDEVLRAGGVEREAVIGLPLWETPGWTHDPEEVTRLKDAIARAALGEHVRYDACLRAAGDILRDCDLSLSPVQGETGEVLLLVVSALDITERKRTETRLAEREAQLALFIAHSPAPIAMFDRNLRYLAHSRSHLTDYGLPGDADLAGRLHYEVFPDIPERWREIHKRVLAGETLSAEEDLFSRDDGRTDWIRWTMAPWYDARGGIGGAMLVSEIVTGQVEARRALKESGARYRALFDSINAGFCIIEVRFDAPGGQTDYRVVEANPAFYERTGFAETILGQWLRQAVPDLEEHWYEIYGRVARTGEPARFEKHSQMLGRWFDVYAFQIDEPQDNRVAILFHDISGQKKHEEHVDTLLKEVNHRAKNMLSLVTIIGKQTASAGPEGFVERFSARIGALAASQDLLVGSEWRAVDLGVLVRTQLAHFADLVDRRILIEGPTLNVTAEAAERLGMALHELATNAAKYGALSNDLGCIRVNWYADQEEDSPRFFMAWLENDGPPVKVPERRGFGSLVSGAALASSLRGTVSAEYPPTGLQWRLECPLASVATIE